MNSIVLIVPYFGKLPYNFQLWLEGCKYNQNIDWLIYTDDKTEYCYPKNVRVSYCSFGEMKERIQKLYDFEITLDKPYKLCDYKVAYGEIFKEEISKYAYWGYCDVDLLFGRIRHFITDEILRKYCKVGFQGHLTIYENTNETILRYRTEIPGVISYKEVFTSPNSFCFDETGMDEIYDKLGITVYKQVNFAHLMKYEPDFFLGHLPKEERYKNENQIFKWEKGILSRCYIMNEKVKTEEFMYIHFFCRTMKLKIKNVSKVDRLLIYPNTIEQTDVNPTCAYVKRKAHTSKLLFRVKYLYNNRKKISVAKLKDVYSRQIKQGKEKRL